MRNALGQLAIPEAADVRRTVGRVAIGSARALRKNPNMLMGVVIIIVMTSMALAAPLITAYDPIRLVPANRLIVPGAKHWFGTDQLGRDIYTRVAYGARVSLQVGALVAIFVAVFGTAIGIVSGYFRPLDGPIMRLMDALLSFPSFLLTIALVAAMQAGVWTVIAAIAIVDTPRMARLARASVLTLRERDFVEAARAIGARPLRITMVHILPNSLAPIFVQATFVFAVAILTEAGLSFLGTGVPPEVPTWGNIMGDGRRVAQVAPWVIFFPGLFLSLTVLGVNLVGDGLRDVLDPKLRGKL
ncbi:MAG: ABC transporter permease [Chloroflexi bacterium]|nr:ABC transporter permease [Chloroflexota bacterium]